MSATRRTFVRPLPGFATLILLGMLGMLAGTPARSVAASHDGNAKILLHVKPTTTKNQCTAGNVTNCTQAVTKGLVSSASGPFYFVYVLGYGGYSHPYDGLAGIQFGLDYQNSAAGSASDGIGLDIFQWQLCATLQFPTGSPRPWPDTGSGNLVTWDAVNACQFGEVGVAGYFYVGSYAPDSLRITVHPQAGQAKMADCGSAETRLFGKDLGFAVFSPNNLSGCNPCLQNCPNFGVPPPPPPPPPGTPHLGVSPASLALNYLAPARPNSPLLVSNTGDGTLSVHATGNQPWLVVPGQTFNALNSAPATINITANTVGMTPGPYTAAITLHSNDPTDSVHVVPVMMQLGPPIVTLPVVPIELAVMVGASIPGPAPIGNQGATRLHWTVGDFEPWLSGAPLSGTTEPGVPLNVTLTANATTLTVGDYRDTLHVLSDDPVTPDAPLAVHLRVLDHILVIEPDTVDIVLPWRGGSATVPVSIEYLSSVADAVTAEPSALWHSLSPVRLELGPNAIGTMTVGVEAASFLPGYYETVIPVSCSREARSLRVRVDIVSTPPDLAVTPTALVFEAPADGPPRLGTLLLNNRGYQPLSVSVGESTTWIQLIESAATLGPGGSHALPLRVLPADLGPGTYDAVIALGSNDPDQPLLNVPIRMIVRDAPLPVVTGGLVIEEFVTACASGDSLLQFVELSAIAPGQTHHGTLGLLIEDAGGVVRYQATGITAIAGEGSAWPAGQSYLIGTTLQANRGTPSTDFVAPLRLDPMGGVITLYDGNPSSGVLQRLPYGTRGTYPAPEPGSSLVRGAGGSYQLSEIPAPRNRFGAVTSGTYCPCPDARALFDGRDATFTGPFADSTFVASPYVGNIRYNLTAATMSASGSRGFTRIKTTDMFALRGLPPGTPMSFEARMRYVTSGSVSYLSPVQSAGYEASLQVILGASAKIEQEINHLSWPRAFNVDSTLTAVVTTRIGRPFFLESTVGAGGIAEGGSAAIGPTSLTFRGLIPGALLESCGGFEKATPVPIELAVVSAEWVDGFARITWLGPAMREPLFVDRRTDDTDWATVARVTPDSDGRYVIEDDDIASGQRYAWRLRGPSITTAETWLSVPAAPAPPLILTARWDRGTRAVVVHLDHGTTGPADVTLLDVTGRLLARREAHLKEDGVLDVSFDGATNLAAGIYFVRGRSGEAEARARVVVVD